MASLSDRQIRHASQITGVPYWLLKAQVGQESGGRQSAVSPKGASGVEQLMPSTAAYESRMHHLDTHTPFGNLLAGAYYLREQYNTFHRWDYALAAYNAGPGAVHEHGGIPPYAETQNYVKNIMSHKGQDSPGLAAGSTALEPSLTGEVAAPVVPSFTKADAALQGLASLAAGQYDPTAALGALQGVTEAAPSDPFSTGLTSTPLSSPIRAASGLAGGFLPKGAVYKVGRKDQGRDFQTNPGGPIIAPGAGKVIAVKSDPSGFGPSYPVVRFTSGPYKGKTMYIGHTLSRLKPGQRFRQGQVISVTGTHGIGNATTPGWGEIGYAPGGNPGSFGQQTPF